MRVTEKVIRSDCLHSLVQAPTWSRAWSLHRVLSSWVLKTSQDGNWTSFPGLSSNFTQCSGDDFLFSWNFSAAAWECCLSSCHCALQGRLCLCLCCLFHHPESSIRQISLVVCLFVFLSVLPLFLYSLSNWQQNHACVFGLFQRQILFLFSTLEKRILEMYDQKKKLDGVSREVPVPNSCLPVANVSYFWA